MFIIITTTTTAAVGALTTPIPISTVPAWASLRRRSINTEHIASLKHVRVAPGAEDLLALALPLGVVDGVDPVLDLHDEAAVLGDGAGEVGVVEEALRRLERHRRVLPVARVQLVRVLVRIHVELDAGPRRVQARDEAAVGAPVVGAVLAAVDGIARVYGRYLY